MVKSGKKSVRKFVGTALRQVGLLRSLPEIPPDIDADCIAIVRQVAPYTMTSPERINGLVLAIKHIINLELPGAIVECGVYRGGSMMAAALTLTNAGITDREMYLFDTYEGMSTPTEKDVDRSGKAAKEKFDRLRRADGSAWCYASIEDVQANLATTGYPMQRMHFVKGMVEATLPAQAPTQIALLRLDTDWYESTRHEMEHLYPRLVPGGVLILDDYGKWQGSRRAVDEYLTAHGIHLLLNRLDDHGRIALKP